MKKILFIVLILAMSANGWSEEAPKHGHKWTAVWTAIGFGGGFVGGMMYGFANYDDDIGAESKIWTSTLVFAVAGGIGGFFLGHHWDRERAMKNIQTGRIIWPEDRLPNFDIKSPSRYE
jgi:hypothetical protein